MGKAIILDDVSFAEINIGKVHIIGDEPVLGISIISEDSYLSEEFQCDVEYTPNNTSERGVIWSIDSEEFATIDESGLVTIKPNVDHQSITISAVSKHNPQVTASKMITVTYKKHWNPEWIDFEDDNCRLALMAAIPGIDSDGDGHITYSDAANVTNSQIVNLPKFFDGGDEYGYVTKFNEFKYFTGVTSITTSDWCDSRIGRGSHLEEITIPSSITTFGSRTFRQIPLKKLKWDENSQFTTYSVNSSIIYQITTMEEADFPNGLTLINPTSASAGQNFAIGGQSADKFCNVTIGRNNITLAGQGHSLLLQCNVTLAGYDYCNKLVDRRIFQQCKILDLPDICHLPNIISPEILGRTQGLKIIVFDNLTESVPRSEIIGNFDDTPFRYLKDTEAVFCPKFVSMNDYKDFSDLGRENIMKVFDFGPNTTNFAHSSLYGANSNLCIVLRSSTVPSILGGTSVNNGGKYLFVPANSVETYKSATGWTGLSSKIKAIGGDEWIAEYGSADEYADYDKYGVEHPEV